MTFRTERHVPRLGVMLVGWGGNNGTTVTAAVLANKLGLTWMTKTGLKVSGMMTPCRSNTMHVNMIVTMLIFIGYKGTNYNVKYNRTKTVSEWWCGVLAFFENFQ